MVQEFLILMQLIKMDFKITNILILHVHVGRGSLYYILFTTWARFPLFSQGIKFNIPRSLPTI